MYNPDYCARPHVVALNKTDLLQLSGDTSAAATTAQEVKSLVSTVSSHPSRSLNWHCVSPPVPPPPFIAWEFNFQQ